MSSQTTSTKKEAFQNLRHKAEHLVKEEAPPTTTLSETLHELEVHQIELELQNQELRKTQQQLEETREEYTDLFENAPVGYFTFDETGEIKRVNLTGVGQLNINRKNLLHTHFLNYISSKDRPSFRDHLTAVLQTSRKQVVEVQVHPKDQPLFYARLYSTSFTTTGGTKECHSAVIDITPQVQANQKLRSFQEELEAKVIERTVTLKKTTNELTTVNNELEAFSYSVSHDLRAPLRTVNGFSQALYEDYADKLSDQGKKYLTRIHDAAVVMDSLIDALLRLSRLTRAGLHFEPVNLSTLTKSILDKLQESSPERKVELHIAPDIIVTGDKSLLEIFMRNLLSNAWKYTLKTAHPVITFGVKKNETTTYYVQDNGAGFDMKYKDKLFVPFQRLHAEAEFKGTGIGLATALRIINRHHGSIWADSKPGNGATFYFRMPKFY
jgi:PAS domain S-box-containing protein